MTDIKPIPGSIDKSLYVAEFHSMNPDCEAEASQPDGESEALQGAPLEQVKIVT